MKEEKFSRLTMDDEKLIKLVRSHEPIYDFTHSKYMDKVFKNTIWEKIAQEMKVEGG